MPLHCQSRKTIRDDEDSIVFPRGKQLRRLFAQRPPKIRPPEISNPIPGPAFECQRRQPTPPEFIAKHSHVDGCMNRIPCPRMRQLKIKQRTCPQPHPGALQADPRRSVTPQRFSRRERHLCRSEIQFRFDPLSFVHTPPTREKPEHLTSTGHRCSARPQTPGPAEVPEHAAGITHREIMSSDSEASLRLPRAL